MKLQRLVYSSTATDAVSLGTVADILRSSKDRNRCLDITGLLVTNDAAFLQVLEGPPAAVSLLVGKIFSDARHGAVHILSHEWTDTRLFASWSMEGVYLDHWPEEEREALAARFGREGPKGVRIPAEPHEAMALLLEVQARFRQREAASPQTTGSSA
jgi:hypothetical protein